MVSFVDGPKVLFFLSHLWMTFMHDLGIFPKIIFFKQKFKYLPMDGPKEICDMEVWRDI